MAVQSHQFIMKTGPNPGKIFVIQKAETTIGRDETSDIFILDSGVSRHHATLTLQGTKYVLRDLGSTNGSFVNDQRLTGPRSLNPGDVILFGDKVQLIFEVAQYDPEATIQRLKPQPDAEPFIPARPEPQRAMPQVPVSPQRGARPRPVSSAMNFDPAKYDAEDERRKKMVPWIAGGVGCLVLFCIVAALILWYIDANMLWCDIFPFLAGCP